MIDTGKILLDVAFQGVSTFLGKALKTIYRNMGSFPFTCCIGIVNERGIKNRLKNIVNGVMYHPISIGSSADDTLLGFKNLEVMVRSRLIAFGR